MVMVMAMVMAMAMVSPFTSAKEANPVGWSQCSAILASRADDVGRATCTSSNTITIPITCPSQGDFVFTYSLMYPYRYFARGNGKNTVCVRFQRRYEGKCGVVLARDAFYWLFVRIYGAYDSHITHFNLENNNIVGLTSLTFYYMKTVRHLDLEIGNNIRDLPSLAFAGLDSLVNLYLRGQNFKEIKSNTFSSYGLSKLTTIDLRCNGIQTVRDYAFYYSTLLYRYENLMDLDLVNLRYNEIKTIEENAFAYLDVETLILCFNRMTSLPKQLFNDYKVYNYFGWLIGTYPTLQTVHYIALKGLGPTLRCKPNKPQHWVSKHSFIADFSIGDLPTCAEA